MCRDAVRLVAGGRGSMQCSSGPLAAPAYAGQNPTPRELDLPRLGRVTETPFFRHWPGFAQNTPKGFVG